MSPGHAMDIEDPSRESELAVGLGMSVKISRRSLVSGVALILPAKIGANRHLISVESGR
jgi:hypothetical protein